MCCPLLALGVTLCLGGFVNKWDDIEDLIERWKKRFPDDFAQNIEWIKEKKSELTDKEFGESEGGSMRIGLLIHPQLLLYLHKFYPDLFEDNKDVKEFVKRFKKFAVTEKY